MDGHGAWRGWGCRGSGRGSWGFDPEFMAAFWGAPGGRRGGPLRGGRRVFEQGDLKYVVLRLLDEKPDILGLAVPGMPMGSPGMEGGDAESFVVMIVAKDGSTSEFSRH